jgi:hypothetical protein
MIHSLPPVIAKMGSRLGLVTRRIFPGCLAKQYGQSLVTNYSIAHIVVTTDLYRARDQRSTKHEKPESDPPIHTGVCVGGSLSDGWRITMARLLGGSARKIRYNIACSAVGD